VSKGNPEVSDVSAGGFHKIVKSRRPSWARLGWIGSSAALPSIRRPHPMEWVARETTTLTDPQSELPSHLINLVNPNDLDKRAP
jgi:hypothetical protein